MSTTIKRVALVAVAALTLGVVSVAPSTAAINSDSLTLSAASAAQTTAETYTATSAVATLSFLGAVGDSASVTAALVSGPAGNTALPYLRLVETASAKTNEAISALGTTIDPNTAVRVNAISASAVTTAKFAVYLGTSTIAAPTVAGTYVVRLTPATVGTSGALLGSAAQTLTITVTAAPTLDTVVASATSFINAGETSSATADVAVTASKAANASTAAATIKVVTSNAAGVEISSESITATISGPGTLGSGANSGATITGPNSLGRAITVQNGHVIQVFADGTSGVSTVTISSAAGKVLATETLTFFGDAAKIVTTVKKAVIGGTTSVGDVLSIVVTDAAGVSVSNLSTVNVVSSNTAAIAGAYTSASATYSTTTGAYLVPLTPVAAGSANITVTTKSSATATTGVDAAAVSVRVGSKTPASVTVKTDKASYAPGEKATITVQLFDATGLELVDGETYTAIFATGGIAANYTLGSGSATISGTDVISYVSGGKTYDVYLPVTEGDVKFAWTTGSTASAANTGLATANQAVAGSVTVNVSSVATSAAIDAANEAAQAASDATDAALAAADAADAATTKAQEAVDAVATLSAQVSKLITALKAQITTLTNLVIKIQKKVKA
jgi:hypothetical protein